MSVHSGDGAQCNQNTGSVSLVNCLLVENGIDYTKLHLNDANCPGVLSDGKVTFTFSSSDKCKTEIEVRSLFLHDSYEFFCRPTADTPHTETVNICL